MTWMKLLSQNLHKGQAGVQCKISLQCFEIWWEQKKLTTSIDLNFPYLKLLQPVWNTYLFGNTEHVEKVYLAMRSIHVSVSSTWNVINASSIGGFRSTAPRVSIRPPPPTVLTLRRLPCSVRLELRFRFDESSFIRSIFIIWPSSKGTRTFAFKP